MMTRSSISRLEMLIAQADHRLDTVGHRRQHLARLGPPAAVVAPLLAACMLRFLDRFELLRAREAAVCGAVGEHLVDDLAIAVEPLHLVDRTLVAVEAEPMHGREDLVDRILRRAGDVGVFDAQDEFAAVVARVGPRVQRRAGRAQVQKAGRRRGNAGADFAGHRELRFKGIAGRAAGRP